jgi:WD40 repeat protein
MRALRLFFNLLIFLALASCVSPMDTTKSTIATTISRTTSTPSPTLSYTSDILTGHTAPVTILAWSPDGSLLASAAWEETDYAIRLWDSRGTLIQTLIGHTDRLLALAWAPDGQTLASGAADQTVRFWKRDGSLVKTWDIGRGQVWALAWSPDGSMLATSSTVSILNPVVQLWTHDGQLIATLGTQFTGGKFYNLLWSPDGTRLLGGAIDYKVWTSDGSQVAYLESCAHCTPSWAAGWSPDSQRFAIGDENGVLTIYNRDGQVLTSYQSADDVNALAWSPDSDLIAGGRILWSTDGTELGGVTGRVASESWSFDGSYLAIAADMRISILGRDGRLLAVLRDHTGVVNVVTWSPNALVLASASDDMTVRLWRMP